MRRTSGSRQRNLGGSWRLGASLDLSFLACDGCKSHRVPLFTGGPAAWRLRPGLTGAGSCRGSHPSPSHRASEAALGPCQGLRWSSWRAAPCPEPARRARSLLPAAEASAEQRGSRAGNLVMQLGALCCRPHELVQCTRGPENWLPVAARNGQAKGSPKRQPAS